MSKKTIAILDVEGGLNAKPYNIGYLICDVHGNIYAERSFALMDCIWENLEKSKRLDPENVGRLMTFANVQEILTNNVKYDWCLTDDFLMQFIRDIENYGITEIWAYNVAFDKSAIEDRLLGFSISKLMGFEWYDIMKSAVHNLYLSPKYVKFCTENGFVTEKGNLKSSAESGYAYISDNENFIEEHTGLADCKVEYKLYLKARAKKKKIKRNNGDWRTLKNYRESKGL